jgi:hypothetical protein
LTQVGSDKPHHHIEGCGFAGTVRTQQADNFTLLDLDADLIDYTPVFIGFNQLVGFESLHSFYRETALNFAV